MPFVKLNNISKTYKMGDVSIHALKNVNMEIESGSFVSIVRSIWQWQINCS